MCDKERLVSYLYEDLPDDERAVFERHVRDCADCRAELNGLRGVRADLISWSPPQPDFGFRVVREPKVLPMRPSWRAWWTPAAGLAAAAALVLAAAASIAHVEISTGPQGFTVRTGWSAFAPGTDRGFGETASQSASAPASGQRFGETASQSASAPASGQRFGETASQSASGSPAVSARGDRLLPVSAANVDAAFIESIDRRLRALESASRDGGLVRNASLSARSQASDAEILRRVRDLLAQSETKQQGQLALRIAQVIREFDAQRVADLSRIQQGMRGIERTVSEEQQGHREQWNILLAGAKQK